VREHRLERLALRRRPSVQALDSPLHGGEGGPKQVRDLGSGGEVHAGARSAATVRWHPFWRIALGAKEPVANASSTSSWSRRTVTCSARATHAQRCAFAPGSISTGTRACAWTTRSAPRRTLSRAPGSAVRLRAMRSSARARARRHVEPLLGIAVEPAKTVRGPSVPAAPPPSPAGALRGGPPGADAHRARNASAESRSRSSADTNAGADCAGAGGGANAGAA
jgi:hypothetical protein